MGPIEQSHKKVVSICLRHTMKQAETIFWVLCFIDLFYDFLLEGKQTPANYFSTSSLKGPYCSKCIMS